MINLNLKAKSINFPEENKKTLHNLGVAKCLREFRRSTNYRKKIDKLYFIKT